MLLQGVAWTSMIQQYSKSDTFVAAVQKTFSGKYRCSLCKKIAEETKKEQKATALVKTDKALKAILLSDVEQEGGLFFKKIPYPQILALEYKNIPQEPPAPYPRALA